MRRIVELAIFPLACQERLDGLTALQEFGTVYGQPALSLA